MLTAAGRKSLQIAAGLRPVKKHCKSACLWPVIKLDLCWRLTVKRSMEKLNKIGKYISILIYDSPRGRRTTTTKQMVD
jgi:hypothetical protein